MQILDPHSIGRRIKHLRKLNNLRQLDLASELSVSSCIISKIETGHQLGSIDKYYNIAEYFEVDLTWLLTGEDNIDKQLLNHIYTLISDHSVL